MSRQKLIQDLSQCVEELKFQIVMLDADKTVSFKHKHEQMHNLRKALQETQRALLTLVMEEYNMLRRAG